ncbi:hypothetical protein PYCC9005_000447 [Savitreella phatthalungensis]
MLFSTLALASAAFAAPTFNKRQDDGGFKLKVISDNSTIDGGTISPAHAGAAIEAAAVSNGGVDLSQATTYYFNSTDSYNNTGVVYWNLPTTSNEGTTNVPSGLKIIYTPLTSTTPLQFSPGASPQDNAGFQLAFDDNDYLVLGFPEYGTSRFYACQQQVGSGYNYYSLAWSTDAREPENPTCSAVQIQRVYV